jgi:hypothetical protein
VAASNAVIAVGCLAVAVLLSASGAGGRAECIGGTVADLNGGPSGTLDTTHGQYFFFRTRKLTLQVPYDRINLLEYGQKVGRRHVLAVAISPMFLLSKKRTHFLTIGFSDDEGHQQALVFRVNKGDLRSVLVSLEARTGRKVTYQDEEARKAGKG